MNYFIASIGLLAFIGIADQVGGYHHHHCVCEVEFFKHHKDGDHHSRDVLKKIVYKDFYGAFVNYHNCSKHDWNKCSHYCRSKLRVVIKGFHDIHNHTIHKFKQVVHTGFGNVQLGKVFCDDFKHSGHTPCHGVHLGIFSTLKNCSSHMPHNTGYHFNDTLTCDDKGKYVPNA